MDVPIFPLLENSRLAALKLCFKKEFKEEPKVFLRVPGRVNLIGEHIDYCGYGVCPMALELDITLAASPNNSNKLNLRNYDDKFVDFSCDINNFKINTAENAPEWYEYFLCGIKGISEWHQQPLNGMNIMVTGNIPNSAGLSSSSALVCSAALITAYFHQLKISKVELASLCAESEKYIGTQGGGMDQAIAILAQQGCAKFIEFNPLRSQDIKLPDGAMFVIAHSLATKNKAASADFNCRVVECRLAAQVLSKIHNLQWNKVKKLGDFHKNIGMEIWEIIDIVKKHLHEEPYSKEEIARILEISPIELNEISLTPNTIHIERFKLRQRAEHVFEEVLRVEDFTYICNNPSEKDKLKKLGDLMFQSHNSLQKKYECSHHHLDKLVDLSRGIAYGARLTGAGWGGCMVALVPEDKLQEYKNHLKNEFYDTHEIDSSAFDSLVFATGPHGGAYIQE